METMVNVGLIQMSCSDNVEENYEKVIEYIKQAAGQGANIVCTQELYKSRYFCQIEDSKYFDRAEKIDDDNKTLKELSTLAADLEIVIIASLFEKRAPGLYHNTTIVIDADGGFLGKYRKMHIPEDPYYYEKFYFTPGDLGYRVFKTRYADIGVLICWDQWFPEAARLTAMKGAEIIFYPTAIGYTPQEKEAEDTSTHDAWQIIQRGHAVANACYVAVVNRVGFEESPDGNGGIDFWGHSFICDPYGEVVKEASRDREELLLCSIDLSSIDEVRRVLSHFFRDRRIDSYGGLLNRFLDA
jgi:N-carbamoylputrescine amidase